jgi:hypothetical protein
VRRMISVLLLLLFLAACQGSKAQLTATQESLRQTGQVELFNSLMETAVFETQVVVQLTTMAPTATFTPSPTLTPTETFTPTATPEEAFKNPWVLQEQCDPFDYTKCIKYSINNKLFYILNTKRGEKWLHVSLTKTDSGEKGYFVIAPDSFVSIALFPGEYRATYYMDCDKEDYFYRTWQITERTDWFYCKNDNIMTYGGILP